MAKLKKQILNLSERKLLDTIPTEDVLEEFRGYNPTFESDSEIDAYLQEKANAFLNKYFDMSLEIPLNVSRRLKSNLGVFYSTGSRSGKTKPKNIKISTTYFDFEQPDIHRAMSTVYHECVHYALCEKNLRFQDADTIFDTILNRLGVYTMYGPVFAYPNSSFDLYVCPCGEFKGVYRGIQKPHQQVYNTCKSCSGRGQYVRAEIGVYAEVKEKYKKEELKVTV